MSLIKYYYIKYSLKTNWNYFIKKNDISILLIILLLVLIPTFILTTLKTLKYKTIILYNYKFFLNDNNIKTNNYK